VKHPTIRINFAVFPKFECLMTPLREHPVVLPSKHNGFCLLSKIGSVGRPHNASCSAGGGPLEQSKLDFYCQIFRFGFK
jgi:hypothetical protein